MSATTYDIDRLQAERDQLLAQEQEIRLDLERLGQEPAIRKLSIDAGLTQLGEPLVLPGPLRRRSTDARTNVIHASALLAVLLVVFVVASLALVSRLAFWQVVERDWSSSGHRRPSGPETRSRRGSIYDRSGTVALASTVDRERLAAALNQMTEAEREQITELIRMLGLDEEAAATLRVNPRHGPRLHRHRARRPALHVGADPVSARPAGSPT